ncbi:eukaryotic translation initiation factor 3 subunit H-like [Pocillopora verrucosa]|uniref:eukaryotic translation initiation factor 3 subunit H-like n=1 Tax=Pocillopora verrucosa TaxID=203993 RepID=UPI002797B6A6|nr:eukaryotic translation initiation factor 3 subunit H-like [Pocillopora verrucosa]
MAERGGSSFSNSSLSGSSSRIDSVQVEGLVVLKIIKHCQDERSAGEVVQGVLLGLIQNNKLEITNCFPFPSSRAGDDDDEDDVNYQMEMMRRLRAVNVDHLHVGWYQSTYLGSFINRNLLDSQFSYQSSIEESVVLIYDPLKTSQGMLSLKVFRLSDKMMSMYKDEEFSAEKLAKSGLSFEAMFEEIPLVIRNSSLINSLLCEVEVLSPHTQTDNFLSLSTGSYLEKNVRLLMATVDELCQDANKFNNHLRNVARQQQQKEAYIQRRQGENAQRNSRGDPPLPEEDLSKIFKPLQSPSRLDYLLLSQQVNTYSKQVNQFATHSFGKLFLAQALQDNEK